MWFLGVIGLRVNPSGCANIFKGMLHIDASPVENFRPRRWPAYLFVCLCVCPSICLSAYISGQEPQSRPIFTRAQFSSAAALQYVLWMASSLRYNTSVLFCSSAVLDPSVGHTMDVLSPFISVLGHSDWLFHGESCPRLDVVHPGRAWSSSLACIWHCSLHYLLKTIFSAFWA